MKLPKIGNLFEIAENQLQTETKEGKIRAYDMLDIIDRAVYLRKKLDNVKLTTKLKKALRHYKYMKTGR